MPLYVLKSSAGVEVHVRPIGCCIQRLLVPDEQGHLEDIVLGFDDLKPYSVRAVIAAYVLQGNAAAHDAHSGPASRGQCWDCMRFCSGAERLTQCFEPGSSKVPPAASHLCPATLITAKGVLPSAKCCLTQMPTEHGGALSVQQACKRQSSCLCPCRMS